MDSIAPGHNSRDDRPSMAPDDLSRVMERSWDELYGMTAEETAAFQLAAARRRFEEHYPTIAALKAKADEAGITHIETLEDLVPLLLVDSAYKSYPLPLVEKGRWDLMTRWLASYTTQDLSGVNLAGIGGIDDWIARLDAETDLRVIHTTGTTGKLSFFPRSRYEMDSWARGFLKVMESFRDERGAKLGDDGLRLPVVAPVPRYAYYIQQRTLDYLQHHLAPTPDQVYTLNQGRLSADLTSLAGRIRVAQAKGNLHEMTLDERMRIAMRNYLADLERRPAEQGEFFRRIVDEIGGRRIFINAHGNVLLEAAQAGSKLGIRQVFSPDSFGMTGSTNKGGAMPDDWFEQVCDFTGMRHWHGAYAMSEMVSLTQLCPQDRYHLPPYLAPFLLDPETGELLPRTGRQTGRFAYFDILAQTNWGGIVSGDKITMVFDEPCPCGRLGAYVEKPITRYSSAVTGEDKITCAATVDNTDAALQQLLAI